MNDPLQEIADRLAAHELVPYLGPGVLGGVVDRDTGQPMPADNESLILAMNGGQPMAPRLMYEFPRAAMHLENKKGRSFIERFLTQTYGGDNWTPAPLHRWLAGLNLPYVIDCNRDTQLQRCYADRPHTLVVGAARIAASPYRFDIYRFDAGRYQRIDQSEVNPALPVLFKPLGTPLPESDYIASDADFVDYVTELMGGFAIPSFVKRMRQGRQYVLLGLRLTRDTERMVMSDIIYAAAQPAGWVLIQDPSDKERRFCKKQGLEVIEADVFDLIGAEALA